jgi:hypothetical protein
MRASLRRWLPSFDLDPDGIDARLRAKPGRGEFAGIILALCMMIGLAYIDRNADGLAPDFRAMLATYHDDLRGYYYPNWFLPYFALLAQMPFAVAYCLSNLINLLGIWYACRVFNGNGAAALLSYQTLYIIFYAQPVGILIGGLALMYHAMLHQRYWLAGVGLTLALIKYQTAAPLALAIWLTDANPLSKRLRVAAAPALALISSLMASPLWPFELFRRLFFEFPPIGNGSVVLWQWFGPIVLLLWLPTIFVPISRGRRLVAVAATTALAVPYMQQSDLLILFMLPTGLLGLLGNYGYLMTIHGWGALRALAFIPIIAYVWVFSDAINTLRVKRTREQQILQNSAEENI